MHIAEIEALTEKLRDYDLATITNRFASEQGVEDPDLAKAYEDEFKKFILLKATQKRRYGMNGLVDEYWHTFIVYTEEYAAFCEQVFGRFLHHRPAAPEQERHSAEGLAYFRLLVDYFRYFKVPPPPAIWPFSHELFGDVTDWELQGICQAPCWTNCGN